MSNWRLVRATLGAYLVENGRLYDNGSSAIYAECAGSLMWVRGYKEARITAVIADGPFEGWWCDDLSDNFFRECSALEQLAMFDVYGSQPSQDHSANRQLP